MSASLRTLRVMTYNVHGCVGTDRQRSELRIAEVIAQCAPDLVALQELDVCRRRSAGVDQAALIAEKLGWHRHFHPAMRTADELYGDAILSPWPLTLHHAGELPAPPSRLCPEPRGALWVEAAALIGPVHAITSHFGLGTRERLLQAQLLAGPDWLGRVPLHTPLVVLGDFNSLPRSRPLRHLTAHLRDAWSSIAPRFWRGTFPVACPFLAIDHILHSHHLRATRVHIHRTPLSRRASDHFPLVAELQPA